MRATIDIMTEFSNSPLHFKGGNKTSRDFFSNWYKKIGGGNFGDQFFREYFRSGNIFLYKTFLTLSIGEIVKNKRALAEISENAQKKLPIRYIVLDPATILATGPVTMLSQSFAKALNRYEINRLKEPSTQEEQDFLDSLPAKVRQAIKNGKSVDIPLDPKLLRSVFVKKQDYEGMAVPMFFPVLDDINLKLEFKKVDLAVAKTIDYMILLVTMGAEKDKGGTDPKLLDAMTKLFEQESISRVIVADYTTKAEFVIPDLKKVLGDEKYTSVNRDIADGLQNIFFGGGEKFSNQIIKIKVFLERLDEARRVFLDQFLIPEMEQIAKDFGFKSVPTPEFETVDINDETQMLRVYTRLVELGVLTPEEFFQTTKSGVFPSREESEENQIEFKKQKDKGLYEPLIGGGQQEAGRPDGSKAPQSTKKAPSPQTKTPKASVASFSLSEITETFKSVNKLVNEVESEFKKANNIKRINEKQKDIAFSIAKLIVCNEPRQEWEKSVIEYVSSPPMPKINHNSEIIAELAESHNIDEFLATILYYSRIDGQ
jgi:hypothetical protein